MIPKLATFPEQVYRCTAAEPWPLVPAWLCQAEEVCCAQQLSKGLLGMLRYGHVFYIQRFMVKVGRECETMFGAGKRSLRPWSLPYLAKWPCANIPHLHLNFPIFTLH